MTDYILPLLQTELKRREKTRVSQLCMSMNTVRKELEAIRDRERETQAVREADEKRMRKRRRHACRRLLRIKVKRTLGIIE